MWCVFYASHLSDRTWINPFWPHCPEGPLPDDEDGLLRGFLGSPLGFEDLQKVALALVLFEFVLFRYGLLS